MCEMPRIAIRKQKLQEISDFSVDYFFDTAARFSTPMSPQVSNTCIDFYLDSFSSKIPSVFR